MELKDICRQMDSFVNEKGWYREHSEKPQTAKNLAISLVLEASELLECFQWEDTADQAAVAEELADVILYAAQIANVMRINLENAVAEKIVSNRKRKWVSTE
jgi:NTP pyrophosphatase (non-canonical NTP hydrolase)